MSTKLKTAVVGSWLIGFQRANYWRWTVGGKVKYFYVSTFQGPQPNQTGHRMIIGPFAFWAAKFK
jgi:hypothetical protein